MSYLIIKNYTEMEYAKLSNIELEGIDYLDYPECSDAYIVGADYEGKPMTEEQLEYMGENYPEFAGKFLHS